MNRKISQEEFIRRAKAVNGDGYDYDSINYEGMTKKIHVVGIDGEFDIWPYNFLRRRPNHKKNSPGWKGDRRKPLHGVGINDEFGVTRTLAYSKWSAIIERCYKPNRGKRYTSYIGCSICDEWKRFSKFREWFEKNYVHGYDLDKDLLKRGNRVYCPEYCCFIPRELNRIIAGLNIEKDNGLPIGVDYSGSMKNPYIVKIKSRGRCIYAKLFKTKEEASEAYRKKKGEEIRRIAGLYFQEGKISELIYSCFLSFEI